jgi:hypothetical protein
MIAINPVDMAKLIVATDTSDKSLAVLAARVKKNLTGHGVKITKQKNVKVDGVQGIQLDTAQGKLKVWVTVFNTKNNAYMFGCAGMEDSKQSAKVCSDVRDQMHFAK